MTNRNESNASAPAVLPVNIRQALALAASIIRRMSGSRLDKDEMNGLIANVRNTYGVRKYEKGK